MKGSPLPFFLLVLLLSVPFWWLGRVSALQIIPGLSVSVLMAFCPMVAALLLVHRSNGTRGVMELLMRSIDLRRITHKRWYLPILLLMPAISVGVYGLMRALDLPLPASLTQPLAGAHIVSALLMLFAFFLGALGEELGWSGYALDPLLKRWGALQASLILGAVAIAWHLVPLLNMHRTPVWIAWWCLYAVAARILIVWLYNNTAGSVFAVALFHATLNLSFVLFPVNGSHFDMQLGALLTACAAALVIVFWGTETLAQYSTCGRRRPAQALVSLGILTLALWGTFTIVMPVFRFPKPTGPFAIGTLTFHWVDAWRADIFSADSNARRELMVQLWYPASASPTSTSSASARAPYMQDAEPVTAAIAQLHDMQRYFFSQFTHVTTNAVASAPIATSQPSYPVLIFLEGATGFRQMNTFQVEELVSHGYIVAAIDQPGAAANVVFPDGHQRNGVPVPQLKALIRPSYMPSATAPLLQGRALAAGSIIPFLTQDVGFVLDRLAVLNQADPNQILTKRMDLRRVGVSGVSLGGIVGAQACLVEPRLSACLMMDAPMPSDVVTAVLVKPSMWSDMRGESFY